MKPLNHLRKSLGWLTTVAALIGTFAFVPQAGADGGDTGLIHACVKVSGSVRIVGANTTCLPVETPLHWPTVAKVDAITEPQFFNVNCGAGETVANALAQATTLGPVFININGVCVEAVTIERDDVALHGVSAGDGLQAPSADSTVLLLNRAHRISLSQLTITGGRTGLQMNASSMFGINLRVTGALETNILARDTSFGFLANANVEDAGVFGVQAGPGAHLTVQGGIINNNSVGAAADEGTIQLYGGVVVRNSSGVNVSAAHAGSATLIDATVENAGIDGVMAFSGGAVKLDAATVVRNNGRHGVDAHAGAASIVGSLITGNTASGILGFNGGRIDLQGGAIVENNGGSGVELRVGSSLHIADGAIIRNSAQHGIFIGDVSVATLGNPNQPLPQIIDNGGWGIFCDPPPAVAQIAGGSATFSGNTAGDENCPGL